MAIVPNSTITLYHDVDVDNDETLAFSTPQKRTDYFREKILEQHQRCKAVPKTGEIKLDVEWSTISQCNYMSFVNPRFGNKTYYCRVIDFEFITDRTCRLTWMIDWWMTDMFTIEMDECYVERSGLSEVDYQRSVENPYDPRIMEFRTVENLPINHDIEKAYYTYGNTNASDGVFAGDAVCNDHDIPNRMGMLLIFSDVNLSNADGDTGPGAGTPSSYLKQYITELVYSGTQRKENLCFYKFSPALYDYLVNTAGYTVQAQFGRGTLWDNDTLGTLYPCGANFIQAPASYVYVDEMANSTENPTSYNTFSKILGWFTDNSCLDNILGIYAIPTGLMMFSGNLVNQPIQVNMRTAASQTVTNRKLDLYPFAYYKVCSPTGDEKELRIEDFKAAQDGEEYCPIGISMDVVERPTLIVAPRNYRASGASPHNPTVNMNYQEALLFSSFCQVPYSIDAFRIEQASQANSIIGNNTVMYEYTRQGQMSANSAVLQALKAYTAEDLKSIANDAAGAEADGLLNNLGRDFFSGLTNVAAEQALYESAPLRKWGLEAEMIGEAQKVLMGDTDNAIYENLKMTRPAYASSQYHAMGIPSTNYNYNSFIDVLILKVSIRPEILAQYDKYLTMYGLSSGKTEIPKIMSFVNGSMNPGAEAPHWYTLNGKQVFYVKTVGCKILKKNLLSAAYVRQLFDNGCRFLNGDSLISGGNGGE